MNRIILIILIFCSTCLHAQEVRPFFNTISIENGLPEGYVQVSMQDKLGYLWFGTQNGLVRYDGYDTKVYPMYGNDGKPINQPSVRNLFEDKQGRLWATIMNEGFYYFDSQKDIFCKATLNHLNGSVFLSGNDFKYFYNRQQDTFWYLYTYHESKHKVLALLDLNHGTIDSFSINGKDRHFIPLFEDGDIAQDATGKIWITTDSLLSYFDTEKNNFEPYFVIPDNKKIIRFSSITADPTDNETLWLNTYLANNNPGRPQAPYIRKFLQFNTKTKAYKTFAPDIKDQGAIADNCIQIFADSLKRVWFSTGKGISLFDHRHETFINYAVSLPIVYNIKTQIELVTSDKQGNLWMGFKYGLFYLDIISGNTTLCGHKEEAGSLPEITDGANKIFFDRSGALWVSIPFKGIAYLDPQKSFFNPVKFHASVRKNSKNTVVTANHINGLYNDSTFFVTDAKSLFIWNYKANCFQKINLNATIDASKISTVLADKEGLIWIASGRGLFCYSPLTKEIKNYRNDPTDNSTLGSDYVNALTEDNDNNLWIGTGGNGLNSFNKKNKKFTRYPYIRDNSNTKPKNVLNDPVVLCLLFDTEGMLWVGTNNGSLNRFDKKSGNFTTYLNDKDGFLSVISLYEDSRKRMWVGTYLAGLFLVDKNTGILKRFSEKKRMPSDDIISISEDMKGNIWLATPYGLSKLNPDNDSVVNYSKINGFPSVQTENIYKGSDGLFFVAIGNGVIPFDPNNMVKSSVLPAVVIESLKYHAANKTANNKDTILFSDERQKLKLKFNENKIVFQYVALHFANSSLNQYAYWLEGYDEDWIQAGTQRSATYTNLSPGNYTFHVKASNNDGVWNETGTSFTFTIGPPIWQTWWFRVVASVSLIVLIYGIVRWRLQQKFRLQLERSEKERQLAEQKQQSAELKIQALRAQMNPHFIFNCLNSINRFILTNEATKAADHLTKFAKLIRIVLQQSSKPLIPLEDELYCLQLYMDLEALRFEIPFYYEINCNGIDTSSVMIPSLLIQPFVENAIWHGLHPKENENGRINIDLSLRNEILHCSICDNGVGRKSSTEFKEDSGNWKKSLGIKLTQHRLQLFESSLKPEEAEIVINDMVNEAGQSAGTCVHIKIPVKSV